MNTRPIPINIQPINPCCQHPSPLHQMTKTDARSIGTEPAPSKDETDTESFTFKPASSDAETDAESTAAEHNFSEDKTDVGLKNTSLDDPDKESVNSEAASSDDDSDAESINSDFAALLQILKLNSSSRKSSAVENIAIFSSLSACPIFRYLKKGTIRLSILKIYRDIR